MRKVLLFKICLFFFVFNAQSQVDAIKYLPKGYSKKADVDYTRFIQQAINENEKLKLPDFPLLINHDGLKLKSNFELYFQPNSKLILQKSLTRSYEVLNLENIKNVNIYNPKIIAERHSHIDGKKRTGEWGMCIAIRSSENIKIYNAELYDAWGDGIYLGKSLKNRHRTNKNIDIVGVKIYNARRNGISITTAEKLSLSNIYIEGVTGTSPKAAIDIEPNGVEDVIKEIKISRLVTKNNGYGMLISLRRLVGEKANGVSILLENHTDEGSVQAFRYAGFNNASTSKNLVGLGGRIVVKNSKWVNNKGSFTYEDGRQLLPEINFYGIVRFSNKNGNNAENYEYHNSLKNITKRQSNIKFFESDN